MTMLLHAHGATEGASLFIQVLDSVVLDALIDTLKIIPFLFLTYLLMEFIEHKASGRTVALLEKSGKAGPAIGGVLGVLPQCAFSAVAANLYTGRVISLGTLIAVFLSTSDEMLPIMISSGASWQSILVILGYKLTVGILMGFVIDLVMHLLRRDKEKIDIDEICDNDNCHCERGLLFSALHHTLTISAFILIVTLAINALVFFVGEEALGSIVSRIPVLSHLIAAIIGLIPGCATSVALTTLGLEGIISGGTMMAGLFSGAGVGVLILARLNRRPKENLIILGLLVGIGFTFGLIFDLFNFAQLFA